LNQEAPGVSAISLAAHSAAADAPRYGEQASVEHHPQVTVFVPRKMRTMMLMLLLGLGTAAAAEALAHFADDIAARSPGMSAAELRDQLAGGAVAWASAVELLVAAMLAKLVYSLRRHRVDDYSGRYRVWRWMAWGGLLASADSVIGGREVFAKAAATATGFSVTASASEWWLAPAALIGAWIFVRLVLEIAECRTALISVLFAAGCYGVAAAGALGFSPELAGWGGAITRTLPLAAHTIGLVGLMFFGRYVVLDVQGLIEHAPQAAAPKKAKKKTVARDSDDEETAPPAISARMGGEAKGAVAREGSANSHDWEDDSDEDDENGAVRKLSKADRKRLRKQNRAA
jgi:hypothetical protein